MDVAGKVRAFDRNNDETPLAFSNSYRQNLDQLRPNPVLRHSFDDPPAATASAKEGGHISQQSAGYRGRRCLGINHTLSAWVFIGEADEGHPRRCQQFLRYSRSQPCPRQLKEPHPTRDRMGVIRMAGTGTTLIGPERLIPKP